jgi:hypothetical protein
MCYFERNKNPKQRAHCKAACGAHVAFGFWGTHDDAYHAHQQTNAYRYAESEYSRILSVAYCHEERDGHQCSDYDGDFA